MKGKEIFKRSRGITLIALVITIIVLLILAGVTIATLTGDNGLLSKASTAKNTSTEAEILEKLKLAYQDYYLGQHTQSGYTFQNAVDKMFGTGVATVSGADSSGVYKVSVNEKIYTFDSITGKAEEYVVVPIKYYDSSNNEISKTDVDDMDYLIIGETEKFKVISTTNGILAMPYYNLVTVTADETVKQGPAETGKSTLIRSGFSSSDYWSENEDSINMNDQSNRIQQYITKYQTTLEGLGATGITVRAGKYSELNASGVTNEMRNPSQNGMFWTCSSGGSYYIYFILNNGNFGRDDRDAGHMSEKPGVRPVIVIN